MCNGITFTLSNRNNLIDKRDGIVGSNKESHL